MTRPATIVDMLEPYGWKCPKCGHPWLMHRAVDSWLGRDGKIQKFPVQCYCFGNDMHCKCDHRAEAATTTPTSATTTAEDQEDPVLTRARMIKEFDE